MKIDINKMTTRLQAETKIQPDQLITFGESALPIARRRLGDSFGMKIMEKADVRLGKYPGSYDQVYNSEIWVFTREELEQFIKEIEEAAQNYKYSGRT